MPNRKKETYKEHFKLMKENVKNMEPQTMKIDFELAMISACREDFPNTKLSGCNFHFNQCICCKVQELGLTKLYKKDTEVRQHIKMTAALAHLPPTYIEDGWISIMESCPNNPTVQLYNDYFVEQ